MKFIACLLALMLLPGCLPLLPAPHVKKQSPALSGRVIDRTGQSVSGANVRLAYDENSNRIPPRSRPVSSDLHGQFSFPARHNFHLFLLILPRGSLSLPVGPEWNTELKVTKDGYASRLVKWPNFSDWKSRQGSLDLGEITLTPAKTKPR